MFSINKIECFVLSDFRRVWLVDEFTLMHTLMTKTQLSQPQQLNLSLHASLPCHLEYRGALLLVYGTEPLLVNPSMMIMNFSREFLKAQAFEKPSNKVFQENSRRCFKRIPQSPSTLNKKGFRVSKLQHQVTKLHSRSSHQDLCLMQIHKP